MMLRTFLLLCFLLTTGSLSAQVVSIHGRAVDYAGKKLIFYFYPEPVSHQQKILAETKVGQDGAFNLTFKTGQPIEIYSDLEKYRGTLVAEPGAAYEITLPAYAPRTSQEAASPYFEPELYWLGINGAKPADLNILVRAFLTDYNKELDLHTMDLYRKKSADTVTAIISRLENKYPSGKAQYFNILKTYSYGELEYTIVRPAKESIIKKYFSRNSIALSHPAYQHLFNALFTDYLNGKSQDFRQKEFIAPALLGDFTGFVNKLEAKGFKKEPAELVAAKSFYDGFYTGKFDRNLMLKGLKDAENQATFVPLKEIIPEIVKKMTSLREGNEVPVLQLKNQNNTSGSLPTKGKYLYLAFFKSDSKECRAELDSMMSMEKRLNTILSFVPVSLDENFADAVKLWSDRKYPWELYQASEPDKARKDWQLKTVPTFYLISPDQHLVLSQALAPSHNFEYLFLRIYRESSFRHQK